MPKVKQETRSATQGLKQQHIPSATARKKQKSGKDSSRQDSQTPAARTWARMLAESQAAEDVKPRYPSSFLNIAADGKDSYAAKEHIFRVQKASIPVPDQTRCADCNATLGQTTSVEDSSATAREPARYTVTIEACITKKFKAQLKSNAPLQRLREAAAEYLEIASHDLQLTVDGCRIEDDDTLESLGVDEMDTIRVLEVMSVSTSPTKQAQ